VGQGGDNHTRPPNLEIRIWGRKKVRKQKEHEMLKRGSKSEEKDKRPMIGGNANGSSMYGGGTMKGQTKGKNSQKVGDKVKKTYKRRTGRFLCQTFGLSQRKEGPRFFGLERGGEGKSKNVELSS